MWSMARMGIKKGCIYIVFVMVTILFLQSFLESYISYIGEILQAVVFLNSTIKTTTLSTAVPFINYTSIREEVYRSHKLSEDKMQVELLSEPLYDMSPKCGKEIFLLVMVTTHPDNLDRRTFIRASYARAYAIQAHILNSSIPFRNNKTYTVENVVKVVFLVGRINDTDSMSSILEESKFEKDIVFGKFTDAYVNLTIKIRLGFKWAHYACPSQYIMKTDDDVFVNTLWIVEWLKKVPYMNFYAGRCDKNAFVYRTKGHKWYVSKEEYPGKVYPQYCLGPGYLVSRNVLEGILSISYGRKLFPMEDINTGILVKELKDVKIHDDSAYFRIYYYKETGACNLRKLFILHRALNNEIVRLTNLVTTGLYRCKN